MHTPRAIPPPPAEPRRRRPDLALPRFRYVPGLQPHPRLDPGHGLVWPPDDASIDALALDCISLRYPWTAHELLEHRWRRTRPAPLSVTLQGLLQLAVSSLLLHLDRKPAAARVRSRATERLMRHPEHLHALDIDVAQLARDLDAQTRWPILFCVHGPGPTPGATFGARRTPLTG